MFKGRQKFDCLARRHEAFADFVQNRSCVNRYSSAILWDCFSTVHLEYIFSSGRTWQIPICQERDIPFNMWRIAVEPSLCECEQLKLLFIIFRCWRSIFVVSKPNYATIGQTSFDVFSCVKIEIWIPYISTTLAERFNFHILSVHPVFYFSTIKTYWLRKTYVSSPQWHLTLFLFHF